MADLSKNQVFATHAIAGVGSITLGTVFTYPLDTIKILIQVGSGPSKILKTPQVLSRIQSLSGNSGLYSGLGWSVLGKISGVGTRFAVYEIATAFCQDGRKDNYLYTSEALMAGVVAGALEPLVSSPFELIKLREQVNSAVQSSTSITKEKAGAMPAKLLRGYNPDKKAFSHSVGLLSILDTKHPDMIGSLKEYPWMMTGSGRCPSVCDVRKLSDVISLEGWSALWRGLRSGIVRDSIFGGIFFSSWQLLHNVMLNWKAVGMDPIPSNSEEIGPLSPIAVTVAAGFSGSIAAAASHCFDTAKSRSQCTVLPKYVSMERRFLKWKLSGNWFQKVTGIHPADKSILFGGLGLRVARSGFSSFIIVGSYFLAIDKLISN